MIRIKKQYHDIDKYRNTVQLYYNAVHVFIVLSIKSDLQYCVNVCKHIGKKGNSKTLIK